MKRALGTVASSRPALLSNAQGCDCHTENNAQPPLNNELTAQLIDATRQLQNWTGEPVTIGGIDYVCTASTELRGSFHFEQGGVSNLQNVVISVLQVDFPTAPALNTLAVFRGNHLRVRSVDDAETLWQLTLVQEFA